MVSGTILSNLKIFPNCSSYFYINPKAWRAVVIFPRRSIEPTKVEPYQVLLESQLVTRLYLNELGDRAEQSLGVGIIKLVVENEKQTPALARNLIARTRTELTNAALVKQVLDLIETIVLYKLPRISRQELVRMFGLGDFDIKTTRFYEEVREEILEEVRHEVRHEEVLELIMRLLRRRIGNMDQQLQERISQLSIEQLENLAEALLDFSSQADLATWLQNKSNQA